MSLLDSLSEKSRDQRLPIRESWSETPYQRLPISPLSWCIFLMSLSRDVFDALVSDCLSLVSDCLSLVSDCLSLVSDCLSLVSDCLSLVSDCLSLVSDCLFDRLPCTHYCSYLYKYIYMIHINIYVFTDDCVRKVLTLGCLCLYQLMHDCSCISLLMIYHHMINLSMIYLSLVCARHCSCISLFVVYHADASLSTRYISLACVQGSTSLKRVIYLAKQTYR